MKEKTDIADLQDIKLLVDSFYDQIRTDELLGPIFNGVIGSDWPRHLDKMYRFWQTVLLTEPTYSGSPFPPHVKLPVEKKHFDRWLKLFQETIVENFEGEKAKEALWRAEKMAEMFQIKITYFKERRS